MFARTNRGSLRIAADNRCILNVVRGLLALVAACVVVVAALLACGQTQPAACSSRPNDPSFEGSDAWVQSTTDPKCCAPLHNQFICPSDASIDGPTCAVEVSGFFEDDAGVGQSFPLGCRVNLTYCNQFYEGTPQDCFCKIVPLIDGGQAPGWTCGI